MRDASLFLIGTLVFIVSCSDDTVTAGLTGPGTVTPAAATVINDHVINEPFTLEDWFVDCANGGVGEFVDFRGTITGVLHITISDNRFTGVFTGALRLRGEGESTGDTYLFRDAGVSIQSNSLVNGQLMHTAAFTTTNIAPGPGNNVIFRVTVHTTRTANGEITADVVNVSAECR
jgi:hypothetical protein